MIHRIGDNLIDLDGLMVQERSDKNWLAVNGEKIGIIRLQKLYLFLDKERLFWIKNVFDKMRNLLIINNINFN